MYVNYVIAHDTCKGGPLRAEGFPKRRSQFESVAATPHLSPRKGRGSWFGVRKSLPLDKNGLWLNLTAGRLNQAGPYAQGLSTSQSASLTAPLSGEPLRPAICGLRTAFFLP